MNCPRCQGFMVVQSFFCSLSEQNAWKCINCGNVIAQKEKILEFDDFSMFYRQYKNKKKKQ